MTEIVECEYIYLIKSAYKHYTVGDMKVTERLIAQHALTNTVW